MTYKLLIITALQSSSFDGGGVAVANSIVEFDTLKEADAAFNSLVKASDDPRATVDLSIVALY